MLRRPNRSEKPCLVEPGHDWEIEDMTLEQLRIFVAVVHRESVERAAEALNLSQSAVSAAVARLEEDHAVTLFNRTGQRIELTDPGRLLLNEAQAVLARAQAAELALSEVAGLARGALTVYASQTIASYWLPPRLVSFRRMHPRITINLVAHNTADVTTAVQDGSADLGLVEGRVDAKDLIQLAVAHDRLALVVYPSHPWASRQSVDSPDLLAAEWVLRERGSGTRSEFENVLTGCGLSADRLKVVLELPSNEAVRLAVEAGAGATVISRLVVEPSLHAGHLKAVAFDLPERAFTALRHRERYFSGAAQALLKEIRG
jgi:DNA-binding transcriptional LysR family regulator